MKKKLLDYLLFVIFVVNCSAYGQSESSYLLSNNQQNFINNLIHSNKNKSSTFKTTANQDFYFQLNTKKQKGNNLTLLGTVNGEKLSTFSISRTNTILNGTIIVHSTKKAYILYSETNGKVFIKETDINKVICVDFERAHTEEGTTLNKSSKMPPPPILESLPGAPGIIYLDFDGELVSGTWWLGGATIDAQSPNFSNQKIIEVWKIMAEDFRPFNLNVTTRRDLFDAAPVNRRMMCIFTPTNDAQPGSGGVAYLNSFSSSVDNPCWIYNLSTRAAGETGSHEVGHTLGLSHDGQGSTEYYAGHGQWSPIMGWSANRPIGQWSAGEYDNATSNQDDIAIIANSRNGVGFQNDDHGNIIGNATSIKVSPAGVVSADQNFGLISTRDDKDVFTFAVETGNVSLNFNPDPDYPNLNIQARILNELGQEIAISNPNGLSASINQILTEGIYYIEIDGVGEGTVNNGYSDFSSLGNYTISGSYIPGDDKNPPLSEFEAVRNCFTINFVNNSTNKINSYLWDFGDGTTSTNENPSHTYAAQGNYTVSLTTTNDAGNNTKEKIDFIRIQNPDQPIVSDLNICSGESATLTASGNSEYLWYTSAAESTNIASGATFITPVLTSNKTYYVEGVIDGCVTNTRTVVNITVSPSPQKPVATNQSICSGESVILAVSGNSEYKWYETSSGGTSIASGATYETPVLNTSKTYYVEGFLGNCTSARTEVKAIILASPEQPISSTQNICKGESTTLIATGNSNYKWYDTPVGGSSITSGSSYETPVLDSSVTYYIEGIIGDCITQTRTEVKIIVSENPDQPIIEINQNQKLTVASDFFTYQWYHNGEIISGADQSEYTPTKVGEYTIEVTNEGGCNSISKVFNVDQSFLNLSRDTKTFTYYPNPVNDNDILHIEGFTPEDYDVRIVNLQGKIVIQSTPVSKIDISELSDGLYILLINNKPIGKVIRQ